MQGWHLSGLVSSIRAASWPQPDDWDHCPPPVPARVEDSPPGGSVRGTRPGDARTIQATPSEQNDPRAPKPRLLRRARHGTIGYLGRVDKFFDPVVNIALCDDIEAVMALYWPALVTFNVCTKLRTTNVVSGLRVGVKVPALLSVELT